MILQRTGHDLGSRGGAAIDQHHNRLAAGDVARLCIVTLGILGMAAAGRNDLARIEQIVRNRNRLIQKPARIVAQIEHIALERRPDLLLQVAHRLLQARIGLFVEAGQADIGDIAFAPPFHAVDLHDGAGQGEVERFLGAVAQNGQRDLRACGPAHLGDGIVQRHALHRHIVDGRDEIARLDASLGGRCIVDRRHHLDQAVFHRDFDAKAAELALGLNLHVGKAFGIHVAGMRVEGGDHALDRVVDQLAILHRADIIGPHAFKRIAEQVELAIGSHVGSAERGQQGNRGAKAQHHAHDDKRNTLHDFFAFPGSPVIQGAGLEPFPCCRNSK